MYPLVLLDIGASFNTWTSLFLIASSFGLFLAFLLLSDRSTRRDNLPVALMLIGFSLILIQYVMGWTGYRSVYPLLYFFVPSWYLAFGPLFLTYLLRFHDRRLQVDILHFLPALILFVIHGYYYLTTGGVIDDRAVQDEIGYKILWQFRSPWVIALHMLAYFAMTRSIARVAEVVPGREETLKVRDTWTRMLVYFFGLFISAYVSFFVLRLFDFFSPSWDYAISATMTIGIYGLGISVYKLPQIFNGELWASIFSPVPKSIPQQVDTRYDAYHDKLLALMRTERPYLRSELRLTDLADELGTTIHVLSKVINEKAGMNFNQFINGYRLSDAEQLLLSDRTESIKSIYFEVGFNNKASFYKAFRSKHDCTPSEFQKNGLFSEGKGIVL